ncbi:MAG: hypothetical protein L0H96_09475 [Humibacillus sp.]|nr:hypothetical protein [Humibacillus sp.]MDN5777128.1 hypothetical protein [Humibacillus sp.]MDN5803997.1 hypothetical protein [Microlunatus sp.]
MVKMILGGEEAPRPLHQRLAYAGREAQRHEDDLYLTARDAAQALERLDRACAILEHEDRRPGAEVGSLDAATLRRIVAGETFEQIRAHTQEAEDS